MKTPVHISFCFRLAITVVGIAVVCCFFQFCNNAAINITRTYTNPIFTQHENTSVYFFKGNYYYVMNTEGSIILSVSNDPTTIGSAQQVNVCKVQQQYGLTHLWHPQIVNIGGKWYIYFSGDDENTDDHQLYVLENDNEDPRKGTFTFKGHITTDPNKNWAIHAHVFEYGNKLHMLWSGWESRRIFAETQCVFIAEMQNPWTISSERVKISEPEYEWERQWINVDGYKTAYPIYVNEAPIFFSNKTTDKLYVYYSASAQWTAYYAIGELSAEKGSNILDPKSWKKSDKPVFKQNPEEGIYSPGFPYIIPSPDSTEYYLLYMARARPDQPYMPMSRTLRMQKIEFTPEGTPILGVPEPLNKPLKKPSGLQ